MHLILRNTPVIENDTENYYLYYSCASNSSIAVLPRQDRNGTYNWAKEPRCQIVS